MTLVSQGLRSRWRAEVQLYSFFSLGTRWGLAVNTTTGETDQVPFAVKAGWGLELVKFTDINVTNTSGHIHQFIYLFIYLFRFELNLSITMGARTA